MLEEDRKMWEAYADGINDFVHGVSLIGADSTGMILPPEFMVFGINKETWVKWHPTDSLAIGRMTALRFDGNWFHDLFKETLR